MRTIRFSLILTIIAVLSFIGTMGQAQNPGIAREREEARALFEQGNYREALNKFEQLLSRSDSGNRQADEAFGQDLTSAVECLSRLNELQQFDALVESAIDTHFDNWRLLWSAANAYVNTQKVGYIIGGEFQRGYQRGGGRYVDTSQRDRVRALQLYHRARNLLQTQDASPGQRDNLQTVITSYAYALNANSWQSWRLQLLTDLESLPDYDDAYQYSNRLGAPVDNDGNIVIYNMPDSFDAAVNDGERWRFLLSELNALDEDKKGVSQWLWADFLWHEYGVQTVAESLYRFYDQQAENDSVEAERSLLDLATLKDDETIARLATGIQRFDFPEDYNFIQIFRSLSERGAYRIEALEKLATIYENRRQWNRAADYWRQSIANSNGSRRTSQQQRLDQIIGAWAQFEPLPVQAEQDLNKAVNLRFRNADSVKLTAYRIKTAEFLSDLKTYLKNNPDQLQWEKVNLAGIGHYLLGQGDNYRGEVLRSWNQSLTPAPDHQDKHQSLELPANIQGTYLLEASVAGGNTVYIVVWNSDAIIVTRPMENGEFYFVADAMNGQPQANATLHFFGYRMEWKSSNPAQRLFNRNSRELDIQTSEFTATTDSKGQLVVDSGNLKNDFQWLVHTQAERDNFAFLGFQRIWFGNRSYWQDQQTKSYIISNQPVYRPGQTVDLKAWVRTASYEPSPKNPHANSAFNLKIYNPRGEAIASEVITSDAYGGITYALELSDNADLGVYGIEIDGYSGHGQFRVEEYKKPEYEVTIDKPQQPVKLGDTIRATVSANYYFGAPVTNAKAKIKVTRYDHSATWFPSEPWDWLYGSGYWWFAHDMAWFPGWRSWGLSAPRHTWIPYSPPQPELVQENELPIGSDGKVEVVINTETAKLLHGDRDHRYEISVEVIDQSRRSVYAVGEVLVAREAFKVYSWVDKGFYQAGDIVHAQFRAQTLDQLPVQGEGIVDLFRIHYDDNQVTETLVQTWELNTDDDGDAELDLKADAIGQYRLSYHLRSAGEQQEGAYVFNVIGDQGSSITGNNSDENSFRFNELELIPNLSHYAPGDTLQLLINSRRDNAHVLLFERPEGQYPRPLQLDLPGNSRLHPMEVTRADYPNFFVEAVTVFEGRVYTQIKEVAVPPQQSELNVQLETDMQDYRPGDEAEATVTLTDVNGEPFVGSTVLAVYDKALDYIAGDIAPPDILTYYWQWKRQHYPFNQNSTNLISNNLSKPNMPMMQAIGVFGNRVLQQGGVIEEIVITASKRESALADTALSAAPAPMIAMVADADMSGAAENSVQDVTVRSDFADAIFWNANLLTDNQGRAKVSFTMPDNLTTWKAKVWAMGGDTEVGQSSAELITTKKLLLRLQAPRFFIEKDEVVLSANVHNYLDNPESIHVKLELGGEELQLLGNAESNIRIDANGEQRVDWRVKVAKEGQAKVRMLALGENESDAVEMDFPVYVHGQAITQSFSGALAANQNQSLIEFTIPAQRRPQQSRLELRYSPSLAGAIVDALPYLVDYPYGCTEQTLSRFLPTVLVQNVLKQTDIDLAAIQNKRTNLNAQEIGDDRERAAQWGNKDDWRWRVSRKNPVFDEDEVLAMTNTGLLRLHNMQLDDGGWGWFSGWGEHSSPHTTAHVVRGLLVALEAGLPVDEEDLQRGVEWLKHYQSQELRKLNNAPTETKPYKNKADNLDAFVAMVLTSAEQNNDAMLDKLFRDRLDLAVYGQSLLALTLHQANRMEERNQIRRNIEQYLIRDAENQTAYLNLNNGNYWWYWYGSEFEAHAYYLKLLALVDPTGDIAPALVKYLLNNRKNANYWNSTRDTAIVIEAMADYLVASGEAQPDLQVDLVLDGKVIKSVNLNKDNLFDFDNKLVLEGLDLSSGQHTLQVKKRGKGPLYYNAYLSNFSLEDNLSKAGLELKVERRYYKLEALEATTTVAGSSGESLQQNVEKYKRIPIDPATELQSGDLVEIELILNSKNDYEYIIIEDMKAAGFEPVEVRSGYNTGTGKTAELGAYVEYRDNRVAFFVQSLSRGTHNLTYRMKAEIPGSFSALPTKVEAMYAPELKANSDEDKLAILD